MAERWKLDCPGATASEKWPVMESYLVRASSSLTLTGRKPGFDWAGANLAWLMGPKNWSKVVAGAYDERRPKIHEAAAPPPASDPPSPLDIGPLTPPGTTWAAAMKLLRDRLPDDHFDRWIAPIVYAGDRGGRLQLYFADSYSAKHVADNFLDKIKDALWDVSREHVEITMVVGIPPAIDDEQSD